MKKNNRQANYFFSKILVLLSFSFFLICTTQAAENLTTKSIKSVEPQKVCMVTNQFMGIEQIPIKIADKTYYGCCQNCVSRLNQEEAVRYALDPLTQEKVDKALAYTAIPNDGSRGVLYFKNKENFQNYQQSNPSTNTTFSN